MARGKGGGRPSKYTPEVVDAICERLANGEPLAAICRDENMPGLRTVYDWVAGDPEVSARIARAREAGEDVIAADCLSIADDSSTDYVPDKDGGSRPDTEHIQRSKLRIDTRLKLLAKWNPKRWGEKVQQDVTVRHTADELPDDELARIASAGRS